MASNPTQPVDISDDWASTGLVTAPSAGALAAGLVNPAKMGYRLFNWLMNFTTNGVRYFARHGAPAWDTLVTYVAGDVVNFAGKIYVAVAPVLGSNPATNFDLSNRQWERWSYSKFGSSYTATDATPTQRWANSLSFPGNGVDRLGFFDGPGVQNWAEDWRGDEVLSSTGILEKTQIRWNATIAGSPAGVTARPPSSTFFTRSAILQIAAGGSDECRLVSEPLGTFDDGVDCVMEGAFTTGANVDLQRISIAMALSTGDVYGGGSTTVGLVIYKGNSDANFHCVSGDGTTLSAATDSLVAVAANTSYRYRIEWIGSSQSPVGAPTRSGRFYINNNLVATITTHLPNGGGSSIFSLVIATKRDTGAAARDIIAQPVRFSARF